MYRLQIERNDGECSFVKLSEDNSSMDYIDGRLLLLENDSYSLSVQCEEELESAELRVGDIVFEMYYDSENNRYVIHDKMLFEGCYDLTRIMVVLSDYQKGECLLFSSYLRVASLKQTIAKINGMLNEVEEAYPEILNFCFNKADTETEKKNNSRRSVWNTIAILDEIISMYNDNFSMFSSYCYSKVDDRDKIVDAHAMRNINQNSLSFIITNPNNLLDTTRERRGIQIGKKYYLPQRLCIPVNERNTGTYENMVVIGFLKTLQLYLDEVIQKYEGEIKKADDIPKEIIKKLPDTHDLTGRCIQMYYQRIVDRLKSCREKICEIYYSYQRILGCDELILSSVPRLTNVFKQVKQYRLCYEYILKWFEQGEYTLDSIDYIFKLKTLSKMFEYLCLLRLQDALCQNGFRLVHSDRVIYPVDEYSDGSKQMEDEYTEFLNNKYEFRKDEYRILLYYEPYLYCDKCVDEIELYSTGYNFEKGIWSPYWRPDYLLRMENEQNIYYYILDAKFSNYKNIARHHIKGLALKYGTQMATKNEHFSRVLGVGALYFDGKRRIDYFKKSMNSITAFPMYFSIDIRTREESSLGAALEELIEQMESADIRHF